MESLKKKTQSLSQHHIRSIPIEQLLQDTKKMAYIRHLFPKWWYTKILEDIAQNELSVATPNWFLEYMLSTNIGYDKRFLIEYRLKSLYSFLLKQKTREFQMVGILKNINTDWYYNDDCEYTNQDILFAVQYNKSLILFLLYTPLVRSIQRYIHQEKSRVFDKDFQQKTWSPWFEKNNLELVSMFLVEQFYFSEP